MSGDTQATEIIRDLPSIELRLQAFKALAREVEKIPDDLGPTDAEKIVQEQRLLNTLRGFRRDLKSDLGWLLAYLTDNRPADANDLKARELFNGIVKVL